MADRVGQHLGSYRLMRLLGRGSYSEVYLAEHLLLKTQVAIKVLNTRLTNDGLLRFCGEAQQIANLNHPHIARVLDFAIDHITPYLVIEYAPNGALRRRHPEGAPVPPTIVCAYVKQIASALQYAHDHKLIHRDIKPENLLLGRKNEVLLTDFGLAVVAHTTQSQQLEEALGTLSYMAPEQIEGKPRTASDQYALAVVVYEWLTGQRPFRGSAMEVAAQHIMAPPPPLQRWIPHLGPAIEQIVQKALAKQPKDRFPTIQDFAAALEGASQVRPIGPQRTATRPPFPTTPFPTHSAPVPSFTRPQALTNTSPLPAITRSQVLANSAPMPAVVLPQPPSRQHARLTYRGHAAGVSTVAWSPDGTQIASGNRDVQLWDATTGDQRLSYQDPGAPILCIAWAPKGTLLVYGTLLGVAQVCHATAGGDPVFSYRQHAGPVAALSWATDGMRIASGSSDGTVHLWETGSGSQLLIYRQHSSWVTAVAWAPNSRAVASGSDDKTVHVWETSNGSQVCVYRGHNQLVTSVCWAPSGDRIVSASSTAQTWEVAGGKPLLTYARHSGWVRSVAWSPDGNHIASGSDDGTVHIWDATTGETLLIYRGHSAPVFAVAWSPDGTRIASGSDDQTVQVWDIR
jgi:serine/threonine protein kinase